MSRKQIPDLAWAGIFFLFLLLICLLYNFQEILFYRPYSIHQWRQSDCLSMALNYYHDGMKFFQPSVHWTGCNGHGRMVGELPIIYYTVAGLWKVFGIHEYIFRLVNIAIVAAGLFALYRMLAGVLRDNIWAMMLTFLLFTSPVLVYYTINFLPDAPAFALALIGWYFFIRFYNGGKNRDLYLSLIFFLIGGLLKITALISFGAIAGIFLIEMEKVIKFREEGIFKNRIRQMIGFAVVTLITIGWYAWSKVYTADNSGGMFLTGIIPIWKVESEKIMEFLAASNETLIPALFSSPLIQFTILAFIILVLKWRKMNPLFMTATVLIFGACLVYCILFFGAFNVHDYYLLNLLILPLFIIITLLKYLEEHHHSWFKSKALKFVFLLLLGFNLFYCADRVKIRYRYYHTLMVSTADNKYWEWFHWSYKNYTLALETITPYLRSLGIDRNDKVVSLPDYSPNVSLYLMDQKGFTSIGCSGVYQAEHMYARINEGAKYLIVNQPSIYDNKEMEPFLEHKIGTYQNVDIYDLRDLSAMKGR